MSSYPQRLESSMSVLTFPGRVRGQSGRSRVHPTQNPPLAGKCQESAVRALLERLDAIHESTCCCVLIPEVYRCRPLERRLKLALTALARGASVNEAVAAAGPFGLLGSVEA